MPECFVRFLWPTAYKKTNSLMNRNAASGDGTMHGPVEQHRFLSPMGDGVKWGPSRNCPQICGDCERGLDPAGVILPEASSTPIISSESLAAAGVF